ncbi:MAG TPA: hypothetical protein VJ867_16650 [Gemmatimonadaceae bacterium]|nr:hypothetical protein [Gemmatimonadaceae bacterium]
MSADSAVADTAPVVRRVVRVVRVASAIQRVTQDLHVLRALVPLDTPLVVRAYDNRGVELAGVPVRWTTAQLGSGAAFHVVRDRTDTLGLASATFTPGASADTQHVFAEVEKVGRIDFGVVVPAAAMRIRLDRPELWSDESGVATVVLRDATGQELAGGAVQWASGATSVLRVTALDATRGTVSAIGAGDANVVAWTAAGRVQGAARVLVRPLIDGQFITLDGSAPPPMQLELRVGQLGQAIGVVDGHFTSRVRLPPDVSVELVGAPLRNAAEYHSVDVRVHSQRDLQHLRIALVPTHWRIDAGTYAGQDVPIDAAKALQRTAGGAGFWRLVPISGTAPRRLLGWAEDAFPLRVAFDRARSFEPITGADSAAFWSAARRMETDLGMHLFEPAGMLDTVRGPVASVELSMQSSEGHTSVSWGAAGNAGDGIVLFRRAATFHDAHVVTHELLHLIGFGHTYAWPTVSTPSGGTESALTPSDVAYVQLAMRLRRLQHDTGALPGLPVAAAP